jgi:hypothetical protein
MSKSLHPRLVQAGCRMDRGRGRNKCSAEPAGSLPLGSVHPPEEPFTVPETEGTFGQVKETLVFSGGTRFKVQWCLPFPEGDQAV